MDIETNLQQPQSKTDALAIRDYVGRNPERMAELMGYFLGPDQKMAQKAAWAFMHIADANLDLVRPYTADLVYVLGKEVHVAVHRNGARILAELDIPEELMGIAADHCFRLLMDPKVTVAVRVHAMTILWQICKKEPDLAPELKLVLEDQLPHGSAGFKNRGQKILKAIQKMERERD
ncbi:MAG: hypothetical protein KDC44_12375 [Phaeodactylibacter sp.]|nr:hypothetical protein [Phaeodactylibacter sp.]